MITLTRKQNELLDYLKSYAAENNGVAPSFEEMKVAVGLKSKSGVHRLITALEERGHIRRPKNRARAVNILAEPASPLSAYSNDELLDELVRRHKMVA